MRHRSGYYERFNICVEQEHTGLVFLVSFFYFYFGCHFLFSVGKYMKVLSGLSYYEFKFKIECLIIIII